MHNYRLMTRQNYKTIGKISLTPPPIRKGLALPPVILKLLGGGGECLCALAGILIPASAQRYSPPDNYAQQLCAVKPALRFFSVFQNSFYCTAKNAQCYEKPVNILYQNCYQQANIRMRSYGLRQLVDDKSVASCQQT